MRGISVRPFWWRQALLCSIVTHVAMCANVPGRSLTPVVWVFGPRHIYTVICPRH